MLKGVVVVVGGLLQIHLNCVKGVVVVECSLLHIHICIHLN